jgi:hypothetical protein
LVPESWAFQRRSAADIPKADRTIAAPQTGAALVKYQISSNEQRIQSIRQYLTRETLLYQLFVECLCEEYRRTLGQPNIALTQPAPQGLPTLPQRAQQRTGLHQYDE